MNRLTHFLARHPLNQRRIAGLLGTGLLLGSLAACSNAPWRPHDGGPDGAPGMGMSRGHRGPMSDADMARMRERFIDHATRELSLDDAQKARLGTLADALRAQHKALAPSGPMGPMGAGGDIATLIAGDKFDRTKAQALIDAKTSAVRTQAPAVMTAAADFFDGLKPEQQAKVREFLSQRRGRGFGRHPDHG